MRTPPAPLSEERRDMAARYVPLALTIADPFRRRRPGIRDELDSAALMALVDAVRTYDESINVNIATHIYYRVAWSMVDVRRGEADRANPHAAWEAEFVPLSDDAEEYGRVLVATPDPPVGSELEYRDMVECLARKLPRTHGKVFELQYIYGMGYAEIARAVGISVARVGAVHSEACRMLAGRWGGPADRSAEKRAYHHGKRDERRRIADAPQHTDQVL